MKQNNPMKNKSSAKLAISFTLLMTSVTAYSSDAINTTVDGAAASQVNKVIESQDDRTVAEGNKVAAVFAPIISKLRNGTPVTASEILKAKENVQSFIPDAFSIGDIPITAIVNFHTRECPAPKWKEAKGQKIPINFFNLNDEGFQIFVHSMNTMETTNTWPMEIILPNLRNQIVSGWPGEKHDSIGEISPGTKFQMNRTKFWHRYGKRYGVENIWINGIANPSYFDDFRPKTMMLVPCMKVQN